MLGLPEACSVCIEIRTWRSVSGAHLHFLDGTFGRSAMPPNFMRRRHYTRRGQRSERAPTDKIGAN